MLITVLLLLLAALRCMRRAEEVLAARCPVESRHSRTRQCINLVADGNLIHAQVPPHLVACNDVQILRRLLQNQILLAL